MKKLISFSVFSIMILMMIAAHAAQAGAAVHESAHGQFVPSCSAGYPGPYGYRGYRRVNRSFYPVRMGYYPGARFYGRPALRMRVW